MTDTLLLQITHEVFFAHPNSFLAIILNHLALPTLSILWCKYQLRNSTQFYAATSFSSHLTSRSSTLDSVLILAAWDPHYIASRLTHRKHLFLYYCVLIHCCRDVFTAQLSATSAARTHRERRLQHLLYCCMMSQRTWCVPLLLFTGHYLTTAVSLPPQFLLGANTPHYSSISSILLK
jgi:hypothetical protein